MEKIETYAMRKSQGYGNLYKVLQVSDLVCIFESNLQKHKN